MSDVFSSKSSHGWTSSLCVCLFSRLLQLESLRRKRTGWAGRRGERRLGWNTVMSTLAANTTSVLHPPSSMQTARAKQFCQSVNDHCQLGRAAAICNKSRNKKIVTEVKANFKIFSAPKKINGYIVLNKQNTTQSCFWSMALQIYLHSTCFFYSCLSFERDLKYFVKRLKDLH